MCPLCVVGPPPFHTVGVCVLCGGVTPVPFHMVGVYLLCLGPPTLQHGVCVCVGGWGSPWPFHMVGVYLLCWGPPYPSTRWVCGGVPPTLLHSGRVSCVCVVGSPQPFHMVSVYLLRVVGSPLHFHTVGISLLCVWWGPPGPSTWWAGVFSVCGGVPLGKQKTGNVYLKSVEKYSYTAMKSKYYFKNQITCGDGRNPTCRQIFKKCHLKF